MASRVCTASAKPRATLLSGRGSHPRGRLSQGALPTRRARPRRLALALSVLGTSRHVPSTAYAASAPSRASGSPFKPAPHASDDFGPIHYACLSRRPLAACYLNTGVHFETTLPLSPNPGSGFMLLLAVTVAVTLMAYIGNRMRREVQTAQAAASAATTEQHRLTLALDAARASSEQQVELRQLVGELTERLGAQQQAAVSHVGELLEQRSQTQLSSIHRSFEQDAQTRLEVLRSEIAPMRQGLSTLAQQLSDVRAKSGGDLARFGAMLQRVTEEQSSHRDDTRQLFRALRMSHVRGLYGELTLERTLEAAGMLDRVHYLAQASDRDDAGGMRPDIVVLLPRGRCLVVDSKAPLQALIDLTGTKEKADREQLGAAHAAAVRAHVDALASRDYAARLRSANTITEGRTVVESVLLFLPSQPALDVALKHDASLLAHAFERGVFLVTPSTFLLAINTVAQLWRHEQLAENTRDVLRLASQLHDRVTLLVQHAAALGRGLGTAVTSYNRFVGSLERRVLSSTRQLKELGVSSSRTIGALLIIDEPVSDFSNRLPRSTVSQQNDAVEESEAELSSLEASGEDARAA